MHLGLPRFGPCPSSCTLKNGMFREVDIFPSSGEMAGALSAGSVRKS
jgi:hypothetical protein